MDEIDEFKDENGGTINYTVKELIAGLYKKIDNINDKMEEYHRQSIKTERKVASATIISDKKIIVIETLIGIHTLLLIGIIAKLLFF
jgi:uncharacterized coiled-coil DUF342 family protein